MSSSTAVFYSIAWEVVFKRHELCSLTEEKVLDLSVRYRVEAINRAKKAGFDPIKYTFAFTEYEGICIISLMEIADKVPNKVPYFPSPEEMVLSDGFVFQTIDAFRAHRYSSEKDDFSLLDAINETKAAGKRVVIVENLS